MTARTRFTRWRGASHEQECSGSGLFITASYLMHSCEPSCHVSFVLTKDVDHPAGAITVRAMRAIPKDEVRALHTCPYSFRNPSLHCRAPHMFAPIHSQSITIAYVDTHEPTHLRRARLWRTKLFVCRCDRCDAMRACRWRASSLGPGRAIDLLAVVGAAILPRAIDALRSFGAIGATLAGSARRLPRLGPTSPRKSPRKSPRLAHRLQCRDGCAAGVVQ